MQGDSKGSEGCGEQHKDEKSVGTVDYGAFPGPDIGKSQVNTEAVPGLVYGQEGFDDYYSDLDGNSPKKMAARKVKKK